MQRNNSGIYLIKCLVNNRVYIGAAKVLNERMNFHKYCLRDGHHFNKFLEADLLQYGFRNFELRLVERCDYSIIDEREKHYFSIYNSTNTDFGYNVWTAGKKNRQPPQFLKDKIRETVLNSDFVKSVMQGIINHDTGITYKSKTDAAKDLGVSLKTVSRWTSKQDPSKPKLSLWQKD